MKEYNRREFLGYGPAAAGLVALASCGKYEGLEETLKELKAMKAQAEVEEQNMELAKNVHLAWVTRDFDLIRASCAPDMVFYSPSNTKFIDDLEKMIEFDEEYCAAFPDYEISIKDIIAKGDKVAIRAIVRGTHKGDFMGIPATGNKIEYGQILICKVENGKIVELWEDFDMLGFMQQLGMELKPKEKEK